MIDPPENVRLLMPDGAEIPLELTLEGDTESGFHIWMAVSTSPRVTEGCQVAADKLPDNTLIAFPVTKVACMFSADGWCLVHSDEKGPVYCHRDKG